MRKVVPAVVVAGLIAAGGLGYGGYAAAADDVNLSVDGQSSRFSTHAGTVADVLRDKGIAVNDRDDVQPSLSAEVAGDTTITVNFARQLTITVDGKKDAYWTTARSVEEALQEMNIPANARLSTSRSATISRDGIAIKVETSKTITIIAGGKTKKFTTTARTVADTLKQAKVGYDKDDQVSPKPSAAIVDKGKIVVKAVDVKNKSKKIEHEYKTIERKTKSLEKGETKIDTEGITGVTEEVWEYTYVDGKQTGKRLVSTKVIKKKRDKVVLVGTKEPKNSDDNNDDDSSGGDSGDSNDDEPKNDDASGQSGSCKASYYWQGQMTANGEQFNTNDFTAAHKSLPFNSRVKVTNKNNGKSTVVRINDRGPYISGRCLDLSRAAMEAIGGTGAGVVSVTYKVL
ncbi:septal ring lytic transglycosylase RlpA family protein [Microlunatus speluncae]|uniref:septal ring lytic transglycosylase RlpA family protein n=1 Tax=Microlunatus speluncae TaxID=2594267 RepID=UPI0012667075|nr:septal ring lytic transglycosylase RlpA family protein [Microlunatus speluncae]